MNRVVVIGGRFGGLYAARALRHDDVELLVLDRRNHHLFQPLLYQVATATLAPTRLDLTSLGVQVRTKELATGIEPGGVCIGTGEVIRANTIIWAAGNAAAPLAGQSACRSIAQAG